MRLLLATLVLALAIGLLGTSGDVRPAQAAGPVPYAVGDVFAGVGAGKINHYTPAGVLRHVLDTTSGSSQQTGMCFDAAGNLYTTNFTTSTMTKFNNAGVIDIHPWGLNPFSLLPDAAESCVVNQAGKIYVGEARGLERLLKFNADGTLSTPPNTWNPPVGPIGMDWIALSADQCTFLHTSEGNNIRTFDVCVNLPAGLAGPDFATGLTGPCFALRIRPNTNGEVMVACASQVYRLDKFGVTIPPTYTTASVGEPSAFFAMNLDPDGTSFWTGGFATGNIYRIDISTGNLITSFTAPPLGPSMAGLAIFGEPTVGGAPPVGGIVELPADTDSPADTSASARDYTAPIAAVAAAGAVVLAAAGWYVRRRWLR